MSKKKLMFLCHGIGNGGAERVLTTLANGFKERNYSVAIVTTNEEKNDYVLNDGILKKVIISKKRNILFRSLERLIKLRKFIKKYSPDCIISFSAIPNIQLLLSSLGLKRRVIISERTDPSKYPKSKIGKILRCILYPLADRIIFQTYDAMNYFNSTIKNKGKIILNPLRNGLSQTWNGRNEKLIIGIGSLGEQKNWFVALEACKAFFVKYEDYRLEIYGEGPDRDKLQKYIDDSEILRTRVTLKGFSADIINKLCSAKMYISSSDYEGISNAMLEALAVGVPTICTDCPVGGARMFIENGENGFLVPVNDSKALSDAMFIVASDEDLCVKFSEKSVKIKDELKVERILDLWEKEIDSLCLEK